jgi:hypothetical protein
VEDMEKNFVASSVRKGHKVGQTHLVCLSTIRNADDVIKTKPPRELNLSLVQSRFDRIMFGRPVSPAQANAYNALFFLTFFSIANYRFFLSAFFFGPYAAASYSLLIRVFFWLFFFLADLSYVGFVLVGDVLDIPM